MHITLPPLSRGRLSFLLVNRTKWTSLSSMLRLLFVSLCLLSSHLGFAQNYTGSTAAGTGSPGSGPARLNIPAGVYVDTNGFLYVADNENHRIRQFPPNSTSGTAGTTVAGTGVEGGNAIRLDGPHGLWLDGSGSIYVADRFNDRIQKFPPNSTSGTAATTVAKAGLWEPWGVFVDGNGYIYVADTENHRIQKFPPNSTAATTGTTVAGTGFEGDGLDELDGPCGVFVDGNGFIYVVDQTNNRIQKFPPNSTLGTSGTTVAGTGIPGNSETQLNAPRSIFIDGSGYMYVADRLNDRIQKFPPNSTAGTAAATVAGTGSLGNGDMDLDKPEGVFIDGSGVIYVADTENHRVQKFTPPPILLQISSTPNPVSAGNSITFSVTATGGVSDTYSYTWTAPAGLALFGVTNTSVISGTLVDPCLSGPLTITLTVTSIGGDNSPTSTSLTTINVLTESPASAVITSLSAVESGCPVRLIGQGTGNSFVFTGPNGYVFSNVFRQAGSHMIFAEGITNPGVYTLSATNVTNCGGSSVPVNQIVTVTRSCP